MKKDNCESSKGLSVRDLKKWGYLKPEQGRSGSITWTQGFSGSKNTVSIYVSTFESNPYMQVTCTHTDSWTGEKTDLDYKAWLTKTPCNFGGHRYWFVCPLQKNGIACGSRVGVLYLTGKYFGCRKCHDLAYDSQQVSYGGKYGAMFRFMTLDDDIRKEYEAMRVKFWKGKPTKRYRKLLRKMDQFHDLSFSISDDGTLL